MDTKKTDLRIVKTRQQIHNSFLDLLEQQHFDTISVSQITKKAMISRSTFYDHYPDKFALLDSLYDDINHHFLQLIINYSLKMNQDITMLLANDIFSYVMDNARKFRILMSEHVPPRDILGSMKSILVPYSIEYLKNHPNKFGLDSEFVVQVYSEIIFICLKWIASHQDPSDVTRFMGLADQIRLMFFE